MSAKPRKGLPDENGNITVDIKQSLLQRDQRHKVQMETKARQ